MKLQNPELEKQMRAAVDRYEKLPAWMKNVSGAPSKGDTNEVNRSQFEPVEKKFDCR